MGFWSDLKQIRDNLLMLPEYFTSARRNRLNREVLERDYYEGDHRRQLTVKQGQADDNIRQNYTGLVIDRSISMLLGQDVVFDLPGEPAKGTDGKPVDQPNQKYIDAVWKANKKKILLHELGQFASIHGTGYVKIVPEAVESRDEPGVMLPRLIALDPAYLTIDTLPEDIGTVLRYTITYTVTIAGKERNRKEVHERQYIPVNEKGLAVGQGEKVSGMLEGNWVIEDWIMDDGGKWQLIRSEPWEYEFPPVVHFKNLPMAGAVYGKPDVSPDVIELQDRNNFVASNINRIIRYHAHPKTWGYCSQQSKQSWGADEMVIFGSPEAHLENLEMQSDLESSREFLLNLRQSLFDITRTVDISSLADKLGALTNFGLHVLFMDALNKCRSKQELYGEALVEINHRLLALAGITPDDGGEVVWPDPLPVNESEEIAGLGFDLNNGLCSKETASIERGYDYEEEQERISESMEAEEDIGSRIMSMFDKGQGGGNGGFGQRQRKPLAR